MCYVHHYQAVPTSPRQQEQGSFGALTSQAGLPCAGSLGPEGGTLAGEAVPLRSRATSCAAGLAVALRPRRCCSSSDSHMEKEPSAGRPPMAASLEKA